MKSVKGAFGSEFKVGGVVYFISSKSEQVIPALVAEKITRSSLNPQQEASIRVTYVLKIHTGKDFKEIEVDPETIELFSDPEDIRKFMMDRTATAIDQLITTAVSASRQLRPQKQQSAPDASQIASPAELDNVTPDEAADVILPDGTVAKLRM